MLELGDKPLGLGGKGLSSVGRRVSSRVLGGQRIKSRAVWAGEICDLWRAQGRARAESPDREDERILRGKSGRFWKLRAGNPGREEWGMLGTKSGESWEERAYNPGNLTGNAGRE